VSDPEGLEVRPSPTRGAGRVEGPEGHPRVRARSKREQGRTSSETYKDDRRQAGHRGGCIAIDRRT
jgi:hypothetical protein